MEITQLDSAKMESIKIIADNNMKISEGRNALFKLQEEETEYLVAREKKALNRIQKVVDDSREMIKEADLNHGQIKELGSEVSNFVHDVIKFSEQVHKVFEEFEERNVEWERDIGRQQDEIAEERKLLKLQKVQIESDRNSIESSRKKLAEDQKRLASDRGTVDRKIKRLKEGRI